MEITGVHWSVFMLSFVKIEELKLPSAQGCQTTDAEAPQSVKNFI